MGLANQVSLSRAFLAPIFFLFFFLPEWVDAFLVPSTILLWIVFILIEGSDVFDGWFARKKDEITEMGKILDPFADVVSRITYFVCLAAVGIAAPWMLFLIIYRELSSIYIRQDLYKMNYALAANSLGKTKAISYSISCALGFFLLSLQRFGAAGRFMEILGVVTQAALVGAVVLSIFSLASYLRIYVRIKSRVRPKRGRPFSLRLSGRQRRLVKG